MQSDSVGFDLDAAGRWVDNWETSIEERAAKAKDLSGRLTGLAVTARSSDGQVEVTVTASGALTALKLDDSIRSQSGAKTAEVILATLRSAQGQLAGLAKEAVAATIGLDSPTGQAVVASYAQQAAARDGQAAR